MNDLTFGATLLSCFGMLVATVIIEITSVSERGSAAASGPVAVTVQAAKTTLRDCTTVALDHANNISAR